MFSKNVTGNDGGCVPPRRAFGVAHGKGGQSGGSTSGGTGGSGSGNNGSGGDRGGSPRGG